MQSQKKGNLKVDLSVSSGTIYVGFIKLSEDNAYGLGRRLGFHHEVKVQPQPQILGAELYTNSAPKQMH